MVLSSRIAGRDGEALKRGLKWALKTSTSGAVLFRPSLGCQLQEPESDAQCKRRQQVCKEEEADLAQIPTSLMARPSGNQHIYQRHLFGNQCLSDRSDAPTRCWHTLTIGSVPTPSFCVCPRTHKECIDLKLNGGARGTLAVETVLIMTTR